MATLSNPTLQINANSTNSANVDVIATVSVDLSRLDEFIVGNGLADLTLTAKLRGEDAGLRGGDEDLFLFNSAPKIFNDGTYTFQATIPRGTLNEDKLIGARDEIYSNFNLLSSEKTFPVNEFASSGILEGQYS